MRNKDYTILFEKYLRNEASADEVTQLQAMMRHDAQVQFIFENELLHSDSSMDEDTRHKLFQNICRQVYTDKESGFFQKNWKKVLYWAAIFILPVISAFSVYYYFTPKHRIGNHPTEIIARYGEKAEVVLPDGSRVWINSGSKIMYDDAFNRKQRPVFLDGEACFEVAKDKDRPFVVKTKTMNIQALGTTFNVRSYDDDEQAFAVLIEGKIKVSASGQEQILSENQRATFNKNTHILTTDSVRSVDFAQWRNGNLYFDNQTFEDIARTLSRIFNVDIRFASDTLRSMRFSGTLGMSGIQNALDIMSLTSPMRYKMDGTTIELYRRK
jgi:ferric-dicitrate binding protein FerR (iron transport regulator)